MGQGAAAPPGGYQGGQQQNQGGGRNRNRGGNQQNPGQGNIQIQDLVFVGPRSNATLSFRAVRGQRGAPNISATFYLGKDALKYKNLIVNGGAGPDANDPWVATTDNNGIALVTGLNLSSFSYKDFNKITLLTDGVAPQTTELDSESTTPTAPLKAKSKRILVSPADDTICSSGQVFVLDLQTKQTNGQAEPNKQLRISLDEPSTVINTENGLPLIDNATLGTIETSASGLAQIQVTVHAVDATLTILDPATGEKATKKLEYTA